MTPFALSRRAVMAGTAAALTTAALPAFAKAPLRNTPAPGYYRFRIGAFEATVVSDGPLALGAPRADLIVGLSGEEFARALADNYLPTDNVLVEQNTLVLNTGDRLVLFDTGTGSQKLFGPHSGRLIANLAAAGIEPKDIDAVILTHAHPDHCFGLMADDGSRVFPNAQIHIAQNELEFWIDEGKLSHPQIGAFVAGARKHLVPNRDRVVFVKDGAEVLPGIQAMATPGHTIGHTSYMIASGGQSLCVAGDIGHHHVLTMEMPRRAFAFDADGAQAIASRIKAFDRLAGDRAPVLLYHFPWPGIGHIGRQGDAYRWVPAPMTSI